MLKWGLTRNHRCLNVTILRTDPHRMPNPIRCLRLSIDALNTKFTGSLVGFRLPPETRATSSFQTRSFSAPTRGDLQPVSRMACPGGTARKHKTVNPKDLSNLRHCSTLAVTELLTLREAKLYSYLGAFPSWVTMKLKAGAKGIVGAATSGATAIPKYCAPVGSPRVAVADVAAARTHNCCPFSMVVVVVVSSGDVGSPCRCRPSRGNLGACLSVCWLLETSGFPRDLLRRRRSHHLKANPRRHKAHLPLRLRIRVLFLATMASSSVFRSNSATLS